MCNQGERFDVVVWADQKANSSYAIVVKGLGNCANSQAYQVAYLIYDQCADEELGLKGNCDREIISYENIHISRQVSTNANN